MARVSDLTEAQKNLAQSMRSLRLLTGMTRVDFGKVINLDNPKLVERELARNPWKESELQIALQALIHHLKQSLKQTEALANVLGIQLTKL